jgi:hypothetical protein
VASGAKLFVHRFTRGDVGGRELRFSWVFRWRGGSDCAIRLRYRGNSEQ